MGCFIRDIAGLFFSKISFWEGHVLISQIEENLRKKKGAPLSWHALVPMRHPRKKTNGVPRPSHLSRPQQPKSPHQTHLRWCIRPGPSKTRGIRFATVPSCKGSRPEKCHLGSAAPLTTTARSLPRLVQQAGVPSRERATRRRQGGRE